MTRKVWFQVGVGVLLALLIIKYFIEIHWIFSPFVIILKAIFIPLLLGGVLYYVTEPIQRFLEKRNWPRWASILTIIIGLIALVGGFGWIVGNPISVQVNNLVKNVPMISASIQDAADYVFKNKDNFPPQLKDFIDNMADSAQHFAVAASKGLVSFLQSVVSVSLLAILIPFFFIFMLKDHEKFAPSVYKYFSGERREWVKKTLSEIDDVLRSYIQGQLQISFLLALIMFVGYLIIGLDYSLLLVIFAFFMNMIPFIGPWIAFTPALIVAIVQDPVLVIWVSVVTLVAQQIDSNFITPNVMGKTLDIHPLTVITVILAAGNIAGFIGIIIAVPFYAVVKVIASNIYDERNAIKKKATKSV
ncbi:AI-2E family transporter [Lysinibacillus xylanilyticus]|uniref:AI-2E family transporter n=2 Tax=Lysinibacillus xylanilyticus TaxID=582475 RepID=A0A0K9FI82_9BACI|nr:AI-2E family transporter [Lysinibacillus xylanilyticus]KMY33907.1 lipoprotein [Lysinibacillus xylanilyticus]MCY9548618.1 AI-2E family transporter [Lysinibacillus xylanilyticus]MED3800599.1 AI-2E family transporter [Lysinibacillus xylanilyticus]